MNLWLPFRMAPHWKYPLWSTMCNYWSVCKTIRNSIVGKIYGAKTCSPRFLPSFLPLLPAIWARSSSCASNLFMMISNCCFVARYLGAGTLTPLQPRWSRLIIPLHVTKQKVSGLNDLYELHVWACIACISSICVHVHVHLFGCMFACILFTYVCANVENNEKGHMHVIIYMSHCK